MATNPLAGDTDLLDASGDVRPDERLDEARLEEFLRAQVPDLSGKMEVRQFHGGHANLTYDLRFGHREMVLRRPPLGPVAPKSHDMRREYKALAALAPLFEHSPRPVVLCEDESVIGAIFFVMERSRGIVVRQTWPEALGEEPALRRRMAESLVDALADLHSVDTARPEIAALGRPEGFVERQVKGWHGRWDRARTRDIPLMDELATWLAGRIPAPERVSVLHNDYKLDNAMFSLEDPGRLVAIFDWDMTSLGDPLVDLGTLLGYWSEAADETPRGTGGSVTMLPGFPSRAEVAERYAARTGTNLQHLPWFETFALFKTAVVLEQIYVRFVKGQTQDERFKALGEFVPQLAKAAQACAGGL
ncbi:MAG: phosphotransferase family protein [Candidatus Binatia bacterium]|nr:phosphotransferase family protein [Candidatus Binatia bacterium]